MVNTRHFLAVVAAAVAGAACSKSAKTPTQGLIDYTVTVAPPNVVMRSVGDTVRLSVSIDPAVSNPQWTWSSSDATKVSVDATGLARGVAPPFAGVILCATLTSDPTAHGCATVATPGQ